MAPLQLLIITGVLLGSLADPSVSFGGLEPAKLDEEGVVRAGNFAATELDKKGNYTYASKLTNITKAQKQVVSGMNYFMTIELTETECKRSKGPVVNLDACKIKDNPEKQICKVKVYEQSWTNKIELEEFSCEKAKN